MNTGPALSFALGSFLAGLTSAHTNLDIQEPLRLLPAIWTQRPQDPAGSKGRPTNASTATSPQSDVRILSPAQPSPRSAAMRRPDFALLMIWWDMHLKHHPSPLPCPKAACTRGKWGSLEQVGASQEGIFSQCRVLGKQCQLSALLPCAYGGFPSLTQMCFSHSPTWLTL